MPMPVPSPPLSLSTIARLSETRASVGIAPGQTCVVGQRRHRARFVAADVTGRAFDEQAIVMAKAVDDDLGRPASRILIGKGGEIVGGHRRDLR